MRSMRRIPAAMTAVLLGAALAAPGPVDAAPGTCTVTAMSVAGEFPFVIPATDFVFPIDVDEASGAFTIERQAWLDAFGPDGLEFGTTGGTTTALKMGASAVAGTIDAGGNVTVPGFDSTFVVSAGGGVELASTVSLSTGFQAADIAGSPFVVEGAILDFATGQLVLTGVRLLPDPPLLGRATVSGLRIECTVAPIPNAANLPAAPLVKRAAGRAKVDATFEDGDKGDILTVKMKASQGAAPLVLDGSTDLFVQLTVGGETVALVRVAPANQTIKGGKKLQVKDKDGSLIDVASGRKSDASQRSATGGKIVLKSTKKNVILSAKVQGLDLAAVPNAAVAVTLAVGGQTFRGTATANAKGKFR